MDGTHYEGDGCADRLTAPGVHALEDVADELRVELPPVNESDDHEDQCMARHPGFGCTCEQIQFEDRQREVAAERQHPGTSESHEGDDHDDRCMARHPGFACTCEQIADGRAYAIPETGVTEPSPEQLCFALHKDGGLMTRDGRPVWAERKLWESLPAAKQIVPIKGIPPIGSVPLDTVHQPPDVVGRLIELLVFLEKASTIAMTRFEQMNAVATKGAEGLESLSLIVSQRIHFVELLDRAAAMIDPDRPEGTANYEARLDWLAKWREVVGR